MMRFSISAHYFHIPLKVSYKLSFGPVASLDTFYIVLRAETQIGAGEITPLPGYNHETPESVIYDLATAFRKIHTVEDIRSIASELVQSSPFVASGLFCAYETFHSSSIDFFSEPVLSRLPLAAFCGGDTAAESSLQAENLIRLGYTTLKMKVGVLPPADDAERILAVVKKIEGRGGLIRLDANQSYSMAQALTLCEFLNGIPEIELLEQPFPPEKWSDHEKLVTRTDIPIMLDEAIWNEENVYRAADVGAQYVKFKLCKHLGLAGSASLIKTAQDRGLKVIYGNGVQTALGNHLEAKIASLSGIDTALECNGFLKSALSPIDHQMQVCDGYLVDNGINNIHSFFIQGKLVDETSCFQ